MSLEDVYQPIAKDLEQVQKELKKALSIDLKSGGSAKEIIKSFFNVDGKLLRPALVILSARSVLGNKNVDMEPLWKFATVAELIHNASLIHDDIVDESELRRGQLTLNNQYSNKIALLTGDLIFARSYSLLTETVDHHLSSLLSHCVELMCVGEIDELRIPIQSFLDYLTLIKRKTANFMSRCCEGGAILGNADEKSIDALRKYGECFGIVYQLLDDYEDNDIHLSIEINLHEQSNNYATEARENISFIENSQYKQSLLGLLNFVMRKAG
jgi:geranylgeranyl pyrophosphate synthase